MRARITIVFFIAALMGGTGCLQETKRERPPNSKGPVPPEVQGRPEDGTKKPPRR